MTKRIPTPPPMNRLQQRSRLLLLVMMMMMMMMMTAVSAFHIPSTNTGRTTTPSSSLRIRRSRRQNSWNQRRQNHTMKQPHQSMMTTTMMMNPLFDFDTSSCCDDVITAVSTALLSTVTTTSTTTMMLSQHPQLLLADAATAAASSSSSSLSSSPIISYSTVSYFTVLGLYLLSFPGLISIVQRSTVAKMKRKTYVSPGLNYNQNRTTSTTVAAAVAVAAVVEETPEIVLVNTAKRPLSLSEQAQEIKQYLTSNNYQMMNRTSTTITYQGIVQRSLSQAFFLTFCTALGLLSLALVVQIQFQSSGMISSSASTLDSATTSSTNTDIGFLNGINFFYLAWLAPYAGLYYWTAGDRVDTIQIQCSTNTPDETVNEITIYGPDDEMERMWRTLQLQEKNMIAIPSILSQ